MSKAYEGAIRLLARREHGAFELTEKLLQKGYSHDEVLNAIATCQRLGLQDDRRYAEMLSRARIHQGYGPLRINQELQAKCIDADLIADVLAQEQDNWLHYAQAVWQKKFKAQSDLPFAQLQKQRRFLMYRGFSSEMITSLFKREL